MGTQPIQILAKGQWGQGKLNPWGKRQVLQQNRMIHCNTCNMLLWPDWMGWVEAIGEWHRGGESQRWSWRNYAELVSTTCAQKPLWRKQRKHPEETHTGSVLVSRGIKEGGREEGKMQQSFFFKILLLETILICQNSNQTPLIRFLGLASLERLTSIGRVSKTH